MQHWADMQFFYCRIAADSMKTVQMVAILGELPQYDFYSGYTSLGNHDGEMAGINYWDSAVT